MVCSCQTYYVTEGTYRIRHGETCDIELSQHHVGYADARQRASQTSRVTGVVFLHQ
jgi:hypothetical protein